MSKFKVGDHLVVTMDDWFKKGTHVEVVEVDTGCTSMPYCCFDGEKCLWIGASSLALADERPKFEVGQIYRVGFAGKQHGSIIRIIDTHCGTNQYKVLRGPKEYSKLFDDGSPFADSLTLLTGPQIGEAIRKYDADHAEKKTGVREVKSRAKAGEYIKIVHAVPAYRQQYANGDIFRVMKDHAFFAADVEVDGVPGFIDAKEYVVLEGYQPEKEEHRKAKVGNTIEVLRDNGGPVKSGTVWTVNKIDDLGLTIHNADYPATNWRLDLDNYVVLSSGKHSYTDAEIAEAKKLCGEMMVEAFDDNKTFAFHFYDKQNGGWSGDCEKNEVKADSKSFDGTEAVGIAKCSDHDEYNVWIGRCVALCKALHKPVPAFITGD